MKLPLLQNLMLSSSLLVASVHAFATNADHNHPVHCSLIMVCIVLLFFQLIFNVNTLN